MNREQLGELKLLIDFINKYGYCIARTFNDNDDNLLYYTDGEEYTGPESDRFSWSCFFSAQFLNLLFRFNNKEDLLLQGEESHDCPKNREILTSETFIREFVPGTGFFFEIENHHFHIFYFDEDNLYIADYYAEMGRDSFKFTPIQKNDVIRFVEDPKFRNIFLEKPDTVDVIRNSASDYVVETVSESRGGNPATRSNKVPSIADSWNPGALTDRFIFDIQVHKIETIPSLNDVLTVIKQSHNMESMIETLKEDGCEEEEQEYVINVMNQHMTWLENYIETWNKIRLC